jgi:hypothetical protein
MIAVAAGHFSDVSLVYPWIAPGTWYNQAEDQFPFLFRFVATLLRLLYQRTYLVMARFMPSNTWSRTRHNQVQYFLFSFFGTMNCSRAIFLPFIFRDHGRLAYMLVIHEETLMPCVRVSHLFRA